jgi:hypothetical protein
MATEILINDGGAPARILPYTAAEAISAGEACTIDANGDVQLADSGDSSGQQFAYAGIALTDAASGSVCSLVTGVGVVLNIQCSDVNAGVALMMGATAGQLDAATNATTDPKAQAVTLENNSAAGLTKCQTL